MKVSLVGSLIPCPRQHSDTTVRPRIHVPECKVLHRAGRQRCARSRSQCTAKLKEDKERSADQDKVNRRYLEDELRDPSNFVEYLLPRPLRLFLTGFGSASCLIATVISTTRLLSELKYQTGDNDASTVVINLLGFIGFGALFFLDRQAATARVARREKVRKAQVAIGDREVYTNAEGERMSRLKEVNSDWIIRRLERWGRRDALPFIGPKKGALLQQLVREQKPRLAVEVGTLCGYSTLLIAQAMPPDAQLISLECDWKWALVAKRFVYQATTGDKKSKPPDQRIAKVDVWWADALQALPSNFSGKGRIDLLFLDGLPSQYLTYLKAAEPLLAPGALVVADNAGIFAHGGLMEYLEYVRSSGRYSSRYLESTLEWRDDMADGLEVSKLL